MRYNPPPNWPQPPAGWSPPHGWQPDQSWGPPPHGWRLWVDDTKAKKHTGRNVALSVLAVLVILIVIGVAAGGSKKTDNPATGTMPAAVTTTVAAAPVTTAAATTTAAAARPTTKSAPAIIGGNDEAKKDVTITTCAKDDAGFVDAKVLITNHSSKASNYLVTVAFESPDGTTQLGTGIAAVNDLQPGQKAPEDANSLQSATGKFTCRVSAVTRYASAG